MGRRGALLAALTLLCGGRPWRRGKQEISLYREGTAKDFDVWVQKGGHAEFNVEYRRRGTRGLEELHVYVFGCDELDMYIFRSQAEDRRRTRGTGKLHALLGRHVMRSAPKVHAEHHPDK